MVAIDRVTTAREILIPAPVGRIKEVKDVVYQPFEVNDRSVCPAFSGMIENDI
jgi:hypothetical protein